MKNVKIVAFDCDGVLFDTGQANWEYYNHILNHFGRPNMTPEQFAYVHSHTLDQALAFLFGDAQSLAAARIYRKTMNYRLYLKLLKIEPHLMLLLDTLRPKYKTAIATNRSDTMNRLLSEFGLTGRFDLVVTSFDIQRPKPYPDALLKILEHFDIAAQQVLYVGDSQVDELAAAAAGVFFVAYRNKALSADFHIESLREIEDILNS